MRDLERELSALGDSVSFPETPDLAASIRGRLGDRGSSPSTRRLLVVVAVVAAALVASLAIPQARSAILRVFGVGAVRIDYVDRLPAVELDAPLALGSNVSAEDAPFRPLESALLGRPDGIYVRGRVVTLVYGSRTRIRLLVTQLGEPALATQTIKKIVQYQTNTAVVSLESSSDLALWIEGDRHVLELPGAPARLARNTLLWTREGRTLRLEGATGLDEAIRIAESFR
jgi:hypothetical protein